MQGGHTVLPVFFKEAIATMEKSIKKYWPIFVLPTFAAFIIGSPPVRDRFWSKSLKEFVIVKNVQIVIEGIMFGIVTWMRRCHLFAPSIMAASFKEPGIA